MKIKLLDGIAGDKADDLGARISGAASATKEKASEIIPQPVKDGASNIQDRVNVAGEIQKIHEVLCSFH